jgi:hypothetical protein
VGNTRGSACLTTSATKKNTKYNDDNEYNDEEDGKGSPGGADDGGESDYDGRDIIRGPSFGSMGWKMSIVGPHATATILTTTTLTTIAATVAGRRAPPLQFVPSRRMLLVIVDVADRG